MIYINARFLTQKLTGVQRFAFEISRALKKIRNDLVFVSPPGIVDRGMADEISPVIIGKYSSFIWEQIELPLYLRRQGYPLILNFGNTAPLLYSPKIVTIHDLAVFRYPESFSKLFTIYYRFLLPRIAKGAVKIFTVSEFSKREIVNILGISPEKVEVVKNAVSQGIKCLESSKRENFILTVSSLDPRKNLLRLIKAFEAGHFRDVKLVIAGASSGVFKKLGIKGASNIELLGHVNDCRLSELYSKAMVFVYPSIYEGFGIPPLEAMKCGCPVIVSDIPPHREVCGDAAYYVDPYSIESIKKGISKVLNDSALRESLIKKGYERVKKFSWEKSAQKISGIIDSVFNAR